MHIHVNESDEYIDTAEKKLTCNNFQTEISRQNRKYLILKQSFKEMFGLWNS